MTNREKIDRIYESAQKIDQVYDVWATKHKLTLYEMMMFYEIFQKENREITQKELSMKLGAPKTSVNSLIKKCWMTEMWKLLLQYRINLRISY